MSKLPLNQAIQRIQENDERMDRFANGGDTETWNTSGGVVVPSFAKFVKDHDAQLTQYPIDVASSGGSALVGFIQSGTGAVASTVQAELRLSLNVRQFITTPVDGITSNQAGIVAAVAEALARGAELVWPAGTYVSDANIPNFHDVRHVGPGKIKRGTDLFLVDPQGGQRNVIYVANSGSNSNDGLSSGQPFLTIQAAGDAVLNNWDTAMLVGGWTLQLAAGTYRRATFGRAIRNAERFQVRGPSVSWGTPTAVISNLDAETDAIALYFNGIDRCHVKDVRATGFNGTNGQGFTASQASDFYCENAHADLCGWTGLNMSPGGVFRVAGGHVSQCSEGIRSYSGVTFTIGYNSQSNPTIVDSCTFGGITAHNASNGHVDYVEVSSCAIGVLLSNQSRADFFGGPKLMGNNVAIAADMLSTYIKNVTDAVLFNSGAANTTTERCQGFALPNEYLTADTFSPPTRQWRHGAGWSGGTPNSTYKHIFEMQSGDSGVSLLSPDGTLASLTCGRVSNNTAGRLTYDHAADQWRVVAGGANILFAVAASFRPANDNAMTCGTSTLRWSNVYAYNVTLKPPASVTPANNGDMTFELTSDTQLKIKVKGSDGVVRSVSLTLA